MNAIRLAVPALLASALCAQSIALVKDVNPVSGIGSSSEIWPARANPHGPRPNEGDHFAVLGGVAYFQADDGVHGVELWRSDGTAAGTWMVADLRPGLPNGYPQHLFVWNGALYFSASDATGEFELWRSDGTTAGTVALSNLASGGLGPSQFAPASPTTLVFRGRTDVTWAVTHTLWATDGISITQLTTNTAPVDPNELTPRPGGGVLFRHANGQLWTSNGLFGGAAALGTAAGPIDANTFVTVGGLCYFAARNQPNTTGLELWRTDGTAAGTFLLNDVLPGSNSGTNLGVSCGHAGIFYFRGNDSSAPGGNHQLWRSDGTVIGTFPVSTAANPLPFLWAMETTPLGLALGTSWGLHLSDGTFAGTTQLDYSGQVANLKFAAGKLWWRAVLNNAYDELMVSDGTVAGTTVVGVYNGGPGTGGLAGPAHFAAINATTVLCKGSNGHGGLELFRSDGTGSGTSMVQDIRTDGTTSASAPDHFCELRAGVTLFAADDGSHGKELWRTDGTDPGTTLVADVAAGSLAGAPSGLERLGNRVLFAADAGTGSGRELFGSDGTAAGTVLVKDIRATSGSEPDHLLRVRDRVYFAAYDDVNERELWRTDGTTAGTQLVLDLEPFGSSSPRDLCEIGDSGRFVFAATVNSDTELWISDGTGPGTFLLRDLEPFGSGQPEGMTRCGDKVVFSAESAASSRELWITDGTFAGTVLLRDLELGPGGSYPWQFTASDDGRCAFVATTAANGSEIWLTDGTFAGTVLATELVPGPGDRQPEFLTWFGNRHLYCQAQDAAAGREPFVVRSFDPALSGLLADLKPGFGSSLPSATVRDRPLFQDSFGRLYLAADDGTLGSELYSVTQGAWAKAIDRPCGNGGVLPRFSSTPPLLGPGCTFSFRNVNPPAAALYALLVTLGPPPAIDMGGGCRDHVTGGPFLFLGPAVVPGSSWSAPILLPADPGLAGLPFAAQAIFAWSSPLDAWSNAVWLQLGF